MAVYLVAENVRARLARDLHDLFEHIAAHERAGRIVGVVDADHFCPRHGERAQRVEIGEIPVFAAQGENLYLCAERFGDGVELLVRRQNADDAITRRYERAEHMVVRARRAVRCDDVFGLDRFIKRADALPERGRAFNVAVGQPARGEILQKGGLVLAGQREQLVERHGIDARLRDVVSRADLPFVHPFLYGKRLDVHKNSPFRPLQPG